VQVSKPPRPRLVAQVPAVCTIDDLAELLKISKQQIFALRAKKSFPIPEIMPRIDSRPRFSGETVSRYLHGEGQ